MSIKFSDKSELIIGSTVIPENITFRFSDILKIGGGGGIDWRDITLSGNGSLTLVNAKANSLTSLKLFGACEQDGTPTPTTPVDIICNNGALKFRHQSGLPLGYQPYGYITASGNQWLNTGVKLASTDIVETEFKNTSTTGYGALYGVFAMGDSSAFYANGTYYGYDSANGKVDTRISVDTNWHTLRQDFGNGVITLDGNDTTYTPFEFENTKNNYLFARYYNNSYGYGFKGSCKRYKVIRNGELICDLIPAIQLSDNAIGMYDLINDVFRNNIGSGSFTIANPINDLELYVDGTTETVGIKYNVFTEDNMREGYIVSKPSGTPVITQNANYNISKAIRVKAGDYNVSFNAPVTGNRPFSIYESDINGNLATPANELLYIARPNSGINTDSFSIDRDMYIIISWRIDVTDIEVITTGDTATAEPLLGVGDYKDIQEVKTGAITRNVKVKILDGTETWTTLDQYSRTSIQITDMKNSNSPRELVAYCNYFENLHNQEPIGSITAGQFYLAAPQRVYFHISQSTTSEWQAWLADQYANGTPVIVVYPLATPTTETVTGQTLHIQAGTNIVEITQASIDNLPLEVSYKGTIEQQGE